MFSTNLQRLFGAFSGPLEGNKPCVQPALNPVYKPVGKPRAKPAVDNLAVYTQDQHDLRYWVCPSGTQAYAFYKLLIYM